MSHPTQERLVRAIHDRGLRIVIAVTGGGSGAISALLEVPGASHSILAAAVPYVAAALDEWLGGSPEEYCSSRTARHMAMAAFAKAQNYDPSGEVCGMACTASLASDRPKRGPHRAHLALQTGGTTSTLSLELKKDARSRAEEETLVTVLILNQLAEACGLEDRLPLPHLPDESVVANRIVAPPAEQDLLAGRIRLLPLHVAQDGARPGAVMPGAFNPLHAGHRRMAQVAGEILRQNVAYELSITNVDKPPLDFLEIDERAAQFSANEQVWLSRAARFVDKAGLFPGATFVVGADTIARVGQLQYYGGQAAQMDAAIAQIAAAGCRFLVFARKIDGQVQSLADLQIPDALVRLCQAVPAEVFLDDISSTQLRIQNKSS